MWSVLADCRHMRARCGNLQARLLGGYYSQPYGAGCTSSARPSSLVGSSCVCVCLFSHGCSCSCSWSSSSCAHPCLDCPWPPVRVRTDMSTMYGSQIARGPCMRCKWKSPSSPSAEYQDKQPAPLPVTHPQPAVRLPLRLGGHQISPYDHTGQWPPSLVPASHGVRNPLTQADHFIILHMGGLSRAGSPPWTPSACLVPLG